MGNLTLNGATSGQITLAPTAVAGTNTITLPAATGTVLTTAGGQTVSGNTTVSGTVVMGSPFTMRNKIINGAMQIWQRGTSGFGPGGYGADRWYLDGVSATSQRSTDVPSTAFQYSNEWGYPGTLSCSIRQRIESVNCFDLAGQTITVSLWAKSTSGTTSLSYSLDYPTATDNFSSLTNIASFVQIGASSLSTSWTYYTFSVAIPSAATTGLQLSFNRNTGGSATTRITGVQLEIGTAATPFEYRNYQQELAMCQRYYWKSFPQTVAPATGVGASAPGAIAFTIPAANNAATPIRHPVTMRTTPSLTTYNTVSANSSWRDISNNVDRSVIGPYNMGDGGFGLGLTGGSAGANNEIHVTCNAEL